jgi:hypothetical protein
MKTARGALSAREIEFPWGPGLDGLPTRHASVPVSRASTLRPNRWPLELRAQRPSAGIELLARQNRRFGHG